MGSESGEQTLRVITKISKKVSGQQAIQETPSPDLRGGIAHLTQKPKTIYQLLLRVSLS